MCPKPVKKFDTCNNILPVLLHRVIFPRLYGRESFFDIFSVPRRYDIILLCRLYRILFSVSLLLSLWLLISVTSLHPQNQAAENKLQIRLTDMVVMGFLLFLLNFLFQ